ncbi:hypothetical protein AB1286_16760 [Trinickia sp. NRRL B-1857]|uniref:hypothetical protein n=1 Tax=Trinickia sp. NRRL B-1857 TaxID=3162879 RepID=UPI003D2E5BB6
MPGAYAVMLLAVGTLIAVTVCYDRFVPAGRRSLVIYDGALPESLLAVTLIGVAASVATIGKGYLCIEKQDMLAHINPWYYVASYGAPFALVAAVAARKWWVAGIAMLVLMADMFIGFRASSSVAIVALCLAFGQALFEDRKKRTVFIAVAVAAGAGLFVVKQLAWNIKYTVSVDCSVPHPAAAAPVAPALAVATMPPPPPVANPAAPPTQVAQSASVAVQRPATPVLPRTNAVRTHPHPRVASAPSPVSTAQGPSAAVAASPVPSSAVAASSVGNTPAAAVPAASIPAATTASAPTEPAPTPVSAKVELHLGNLEYTAGLLSSLGMYVDAFRYSEPMVIQSILNEVVRRGFRTSPSNLVGQALSGVPGGKSIFNIDVSEVASFNGQFQPALFPKATFGMANNPWAQAFSVGGFTLVFVFALVYAFGLATLSALSSRASPVTGTLCAVLAAWWGFYGHRNDVLTEVGILKMAAYLAIAAMIVNCVVGAIARRVGAQAAAALTSRT